MGTRCVAGCPFGTQRASHSHGVTLGNGGATGLAVMVLQDQARIIGHASNDIFALILIGAGVRPVLVKTIPWFEQPALSKRLNIAYANSTQVQRTAADTGQAVTVGR